MWPIFLRTKHSLNVEVDEYTSLNVHLLSTKPDVEPELQCVTCIDINLHLIYNNGSGEKWKTKINVFMTVTETLSDTMLMLFKSCSHTHTHTKKHTCSCILLMVINEPDMIHH